MADRLTEAQQTERVEKQWPCHLTPKRLKPCWALDEVLESPHGQGTKYQGLKLNTMVSMKTHDFSRHLVVLKSGKHSKKGLVLNLCPFCGGELVKGVKAEIRNANKAAACRAALSGDSK